MPHGARPDPSLPRWARAADVVTVLFALLALQVVVFGGIEVGPISVGTLWRPLVVALAVAGLRHYLARTPPLHLRLWSGLVAGWRDEAVQSVWPIVVVTRLAILLVGYLAVVSVGFAPGTPPYRISNNEAINLPLRWDAGWYVGIAMEGYRWEADIEEQQNIAFFPGFPLITGAVANLLGAQNVFDQPLDRPPRLAMEKFEWTFLGSALLVSLLSFGWGMVWLFRLMREHLDGPTTRAALLLLAAYPFAVFFSAAYTESLMLLAVVGAFYFFKQEKWGAAAAWGLLAGLTRPNGFLLAGPLGVIALQQWWARRAASDTRDQATRDFLVAGAVASLPIVGALAYSAFIYTLTGDPLAWREAHTAWGRSYTGLPILMMPIESITERGVVDYTSAQPIETLNALGAILAIALIWPVTRRLGPAYGLYMVLNLGPPLAFGGFLSMGRVTSLLFPMFMYLALVLADWQRQSIVVGFAALQGLAAVLFFTWRVFL